MKISIKFIGIACRILVIECLVYQNIAFNVKYAATIYGHKNLRIINVIIIIFGKLFCISTSSLFMIRMK